MLKKIIVLLVMLIGTVSFASENYLNSVVIENDEGQTSIVLRSDEVTRVKKEIEAPNRVILTLKGISQSPNINTLYKNTSNVDGLVIQNQNNDIKIYIEAPNISKAGIIFETPNSSPVVVNNAVSEERAVWCIISIALMLFVMRSVKNSTEKKEDINEIIKEREKALYKNFQREVSAMPSMNYKLKSYKKHVLKGETIRNYESRVSQV